MPTYAFPTTARNPSSLDWRLVPQVLESRSPLSNAVQTVEMPGALWTFSAQWAPRPLVQHVDLEAFFARLRGRSNRFTVWPWHRPVPRGSMRGSPVVASSPATSGETLFISNAGAFATLLVGDFVSVNGELKQVVVSNSADPSGFFGVNITPPFRSTPAPGTPVIWNRPTATFIASGEPGVQVGALGIASMSLAGQEVF